MHFAYGGKKCPALSEDGECNTHACPVDCIVSQFATWSECSKSCGTGERHRSRTVVTEAKHGGRDCAHTDETDKCNEQWCPNDCQLTSWEDWGECSVSCGGGSRQRQRHINSNVLFGGKACGHLTETEACGSAACPVDCVVSDFTDWGPCSVSCHTGISKRLRIVTHKAERGGKACEHLTETKSCDRGACPHECTVTPWGAWTVCTASCGTGLHMRKREIATINMDAAGYVCPALAEHRHCNDHACPVNCIEGPFSSWSTCSKTCGGGGAQTRSRTIVTAAQHGGVCLPAKETQACGGSPCEQDCQVGTFGAWSTCSKSCGHGTMSRHRPILTAQAHNGKACPPLSETVPCFHGSCGCSHISCKFERHGLFGKNSIQVGHDGAEQHGVQHVCGVDTFKNSCECFCGGSNLGTFEEELTKHESSSTAMEEGRERSSLDAAADAHYFANPQSATTSQL
jgi:hypothetical protein